MFSYEITTPTDARNGFFKLLEEVAENNQVFIVNRRDGENVALISESDLTNGSRLLNAIAESRSGKIQPQTLAELKQELGIDGEKEQEE